MEVEAGRRRANHRFGCHRVARTVSAAPVFDARVDPDDSAGHGGDGAARRDRLAHAALAVGVAAAGTHCRGGPDGSSVLVYRIGRAGRRRPRAAPTVDLDRAVRRRRRRAAGGVAWRPMVVARRLGIGGAVVPAVRRPGGEPVGRLLPHRADRVESADCRTAARSDGSGHRRRDAEAGQGPRQGHRGAGRHQRRGVGVQTPRRAGLPAAGLVSPPIRRPGCRR